MRAFLILLTCVSLMGCSGLIVREEDGVAKTTGKVTARVLLGVTTIGFSEMAIALEKEKDARERHILGVQETIAAIQRDVRTGRLDPWEGVSRIVPYSAELHGHSMSVATQLQSYARLMGEQVKTGRRTQAEAEFEFTRMMGQLVAQEEALDNQRRAALAPFAAGLFMRGTQAPPQPVYQPPDLTKGYRPPVNCYSNIYGNTVRTNCQ